MASWFSEGTVTVTSGNPVVTGVGTKFSNCRTGDMFVGPDNGIYQVINPSSDTAISISPAYRGTTAAGKSYGIVPVNGYPKALADAVNLMVQQWGATLAGLGPLASANIAQVANGGTGASTGAQARANLGLGTAATANIGSLVGTVADAQRLGVATTVEAIDWYKNEGPGFSSNLFPPNSPGPIGYGYFYKQTMTYGANGNRTVIAWPYGSGQSSGTILFQSIYDGYATPLREIYHTGNTTRAADGTLKAI